MMSTLAGMAGFAPHRRHNRQVQQWFPSSGVAGGRHKQPRLSDGMWVRQIFLEFPCNLGFDLQPWLVVFLVRFGVSLPLRVD